LRGICSDHSALIPVLSEYPDLYAQGKELFFRSFDPNDHVCIYNGNGMTIHQDQCSGRWQSFFCQQSGVYIIKINNQSKKIRIN
jgi:cell wall-associated NlpC family hydrolase